MFQNHLDFKIKINIRNETKSIKHQQQKQITIKSNHNKHMNHKHQNQNKTMKHKHQTQNNKIKSTST